MAEKGNKIYLTTPIFYVNAKPHLGHAYVTLAADVLARHYRCLDREVFFLTGTDEHGAKIAQAAQKAGQSPQDFCDEVSLLFKQTWQNLNIDYSYFIRTTDQNHEQKVQEFLAVLKNNNYLYEGEYAGKYCVGCEKFVTEKDLINGKCPDHKCEPQDVSETNWFFKLRQLLPKIQELIEQDKILIRPQNAKTEVLGVIKQGLDDISISRKSVSWGIKLPWDQTQTCYVWVDALLNYWTALQNTDKTEFWPADLHLVGRDILKFHCIFWPALILAYYGEDGIEQLPKQIFCHGYFTLDGQKMSKTIGNVVDPNDLIKKYGVDATRYLLLTQFPFGNDGDISLSRLDKKYNADLAKGLGNLTSRIITLASRAGNEEQLFRLGHKSQDFLETAKVQCKEKIQNLELDGALEVIWGLIKYCDQYIDRKKPWEREGADHVISNLLILLEEIAVMVAPFLPETSKKILKQLGVDDPSKEASQFVIKKGDSLFPRLS